MEIVILAVFCIFNIYKIVWFHKGADLTVALIRRVGRIDYDSALSIYQHIFRNNAFLIWMGSVSVIFLLLLRILLNGFTKYFDLVNRGVNALLENEEEIRLPSELYATEQKLNQVKRTLEQRTLEAKLAEQRKNELVMYLAHDIRTPLTAVIGYLSLLDEAPDMPQDQKAKYVGIALDKAERLETLLNELFEITRYHTAVVQLQKARVDLYALLAQVMDEFYPSLSARGNTVLFSAGDELIVTGDPEKLARVFNNLLKNAAAYSYPNTEISISAERKGTNVVIVFKNHGQTIPPDQLSGIFEKFSRLDGARLSDTGGVGLGLSIAKEIVGLHGGEIIAQSSNETVSFTITLPVSS